MNVYFDLMKANTIKMIYHFLFTPSSISLNFS